MLNLGEKIEAFIQNTDAFLDVLQHISYAKMMPFPAKEVGAMTCTGCPHSTVATMDDSVLLLPPHAVCNKHTVLPQLIHHPLLMRTKIRPKRGSSFSEMVMRGGEHAPKPYRFFGLYVVWH